MMLLTDARPELLSDDDLGPLLMTRHFESTLLQLSAAGHIAGTTHTCLGQECIPVAVTGPVRSTFVFSHHRRHGHYLALRRGLAQPGIVLAGPMVGPARQADLSHA